MLGGQMTQAGILATCGLISLEDWQERLQKDHDNARWVATEMSEKITYVTGIRKVEFIDTNIFRFSLKPDYMRKKKLDHAGFCGLLRQHCILIDPSFANDSIRVVTHRDVSKQHLEEFIKTLRALA